MITAAEVILVMFVVTHLVIVTVIARVTATAIVRQSHSDLVNLNRSLSMFCLSIE